MTFQELLPPCLTSNQRDALEAHYTLMMRWNTRLNLTRIVSLEEVVQNHYAESLFLSSKLPAGPLRIADVGSGPGFPGIPIAIARPECSVTLIESHRRKAVFLREATRDLSNVRVLAVRAETVSEQFDWIVSRAVNPKDVLMLNLSPNIALLSGRFEVSVPRGTLS